MKKSDKMVVATFRLPAASRRLLKKLASRLSTSEGELIRRGLVLLGKELSSG